MLSAEKAQYDQDVDVYFQSCAWMDSLLNKEWLSRTLIPAIGHSPQEKVIFAVNVQEADQCHHLSAPRKSHR